MTNSEESPVGSALADGIVAVRDTGARSSLHGIAPMRFRTVPRPLKRTLQNFGIRHSGFGIDSDFGNSEFGFPFSVQRSAFTGPAAFPRRATADTGPGRRRCPAG